MKRLIGLMSMFVALGVSGCLYVAPIEEEDNVLPTIYSNAVNPSPGVVEMELADDSQLTVTIPSYGDENVEQTLYHRMILDFRPAGESRLIATEPKVVYPDSRDRIIYQFSPCSLSTSYTGVIQAGKTIDLYLLLSDERFINETEKIVVGNEGEFMQPFKTNPENRAVWVQWSVIFQGSCPEK